MRRAAIASLALVVLTSGAHAAPAPVAKVEAATAKPPALVRLMKSPKLLFRKGRYEWNVHPENRKKLIGQGALLAGGIAAAYGGDALLVAHGAPPVASGVIANGLSTIATHVAQKRLNKARPDYFEPSPYTNKPGRLAVATAVSGAAGGIAQWATDVALDSGPSVASAIAGRMNGKSIGKGISRGMLWVGKKFDAKKAPE